eukprot:4377490-Ditylum_brightwellii.AAC.1
MKESLEGKDVLLALMNAYPESVTIPDDAGRLPIDILRANGVGEDTGKKKRGSLGGGSIMDFMEKRMAQAQRGNGNKSLGSSGSKRE